MTDSELKAQLDRMEEKVSDIRFGLSLVIFFALIWLLVILGIIAIIATK